MAQLSVHCRLPANLSSQNHTRSSCQLGPPILLMAYDLWSRLLRRRNDASLDPTLRSGSPRYHFPCVAASVRCHDCGRNLDEQDGPGLETSLRSDARAEMGHLHGQLCQRRRILPLQLQCDERLRSHRSRGYLRSWMPAHLGSSDVRRFSAPKKNEKHAHYEDVVQEVDGSVISGPKREVSFVETGAYCI